MAVLGMKHKPFLEAANQQVVERARKYTQGQQNSMTFTKGQELTNVLWAFAILNVPFRDLDTAIAGYMVQVTGGSLTAESISRVFKRVELANIAWSCAVFNNFAPSLMKVLYCGLVGLGGDERDDKGNLHHYFNDGGLQREAIMSLIYLQLALELEGKDKDLFLPERFPEGWGRQSISSSRDANDLGDTTLELNLSTSKIQRDVSAAFGRIGFEHVVEHVIPMGDLLKNQGVPLSSTPFDVISIDIANVKAGISVEVDGPAHFVANIDSGPHKGGFSKVNKGRLEYYFNMNSDRNPVNGPTALKMRLLQRLGWKTINIPFWDWYAMNGEASLEEEYCRRRLAEVL